MEKIMKMKSMKLLALILVAAMCFSLLPSNVLATGESPGENLVYVSVENHSAFTSEATAAWTGKLFDGSEHNGFVVSENATLDDARIAVPYSEGSSAYDVAIQALEEAVDNTSGSGIYVVKSALYGEYISSINGLSEGDDGGMSGWTFAVFPSGETNGISPPVGMSSYYVSPGDTIRLLYCNGNWETGAPYDLKNGQSNPATSSNGIKFSKGSVSAETYEFDGTTYSSGYILTLLDSISSTTLTNLPNTKSGDKVTVYNSSGIAVASATVDLNGNFNISINDLTDGASYQIVVGQYEQTYDLKINKISAEKALEDTINNFYKGAGGLNKDLSGGNWETLNAVYAAALGTKAYSEGAELDYDIAGAKTLSSGLIFYSLIMGDMKTAKDCANTLVSDNAIIDPGYSYGLALNILAVQAYNRAAESATGYEKIPFDKSNAISSLIEDLDTEFYNNNGDIYLDSAAMALMALSLFNDSDFNGVEKAAADLESWMREKYSAASLEDFFSPANTAACIIWAISAASDDISSWNNAVLGNPLELMMNYYIKDGGFCIPTSDDINQNATDQATLALANYVYNKSFYSQITINPKQYKGSVAIYTIGDNSIDSGTKIPLTSDISSLGDIVTTAGLTSNFNLYQADGNTVTKRALSFDQLSDNMIFLAVPKGITNLVYFQTDEIKAPRVNTATIDFGESVTLTLVNLELPGEDDSSVDTASASVAAPLQGVKVTSSGGTLSGLNHTTFNYETDSSGHITAGPVDPVTTVTPYVHYYDIYNETSYYYVDSNGDGVKDENDVDITASLPATVKMNPGPSQSKTVSIRVEGPEGNILYYPSFEVNGNGSALLTAADAFRQAMDSAKQSKNIDYSYSDGFINSISLNGTPYFYNSDGEDSYWSFAYNNAYANLGMSSTVLNNNDDIIVYWTNSWDTVIASLTNTVWDTSSTNLKAIVKDTSGAIIEGATIKLSTSTDFTDSVTAMSDSSGVAEFSDLKSADAIATGTYYVQIEKYSGSSPQIVRLAPNASVTFTDGGTSVDPGKGDSQVKHIVNITVAGPNGNNMFEGTAQWYNGMTAFDALRSTGLSIKTNGEYVEQINGYGEFSQGANSGWLYSVNGVTPRTTGSTEYKLNSGDTVRWYFTLDYTTDPSSSYWTSQQPSNTVLAPSITPKNGTAELAISASDITKAIETAQKNGDNSIVISPIIDGTANKVVVEFFRNSLSSVNSQTSADILVKTPVGNLKIPNDVLSSIVSKATESTVTISMESVNADSLTEEQKEVVDGNIVYNISILSGDNKISNFDGKTISISLPYTLKTGEKADGVKVWYLNDQNQLEEMIRTYNTGTKLATFNIAHLSYFVLGYEETEVEEKNEPWENPFTDIKSDHWYYEAVKYVVQNGLFKGVDTNNFAPNETMTRAMLATVLYRLEGSPASNSKNVFSDVTEGQWYADAVLWANSKDIIKGYGNGLFGTQDEITREQIASILYRYAKYKGYDVSKRAYLKNYSDESDISSWALTAMKWANAEGLITGRTTTTLVPDGSATRAELATILTRFCNDVQAKKLP